ncbi:MAG: hypothetical protein JWM03_684 [Rhodocyclales bacterium]|nr:hypothetical protein [Rhodocyclales bacterium]
MLFKFHAETNLRVPQSFSTINRIEESLVRPLIVCFKPFHSIGVILISKEINFHPVSVGNMEQNIMTALGMPLSVGTIPPR